MLTNWHEVPPTAGLPPRWRDWLPASIDFATALATSLKIPSPQLECSGTAALVVALTAFKQLSKRRAVIVPAYTCPLVAIAIAHCDLDIVLCDVAPHSLDFDLQQLEVLLRDASVLAVIPTHLAGRVVDVAAIKRIAAPQGVFVLEDAAQAVGATVNGESVGLCGDAGFFSFAIGKGLSTYEGGALFTRDENLRKQFLEAHRQVIKSNWWMEVKRCVQLFCATLLYNPVGLRPVYGAPFRRALRNNDWVNAVGDEFGFQIPLHPLGSCRQQVGANALQRLPEFLDATRVQAFQRIERLKQIHGVRVLEDARALNAQGVWPMLLLQLPSEAMRDAVLAKLALQGCGVSRLFVYSLPDYHYLQKLLKIQHHSEFSNSRQLASTTLSISNSVWLDDAGFSKVVAQIALVCTPAALLPESKHL